LLLVATLAGILDFQRLITDLSRPISFATSETLKPVSTRAIAADQVLVLCRFPLDITALGCTGHINLLSALSSNIDLNRDPPRQPAHSRKAFASSSESSLGGC